jgi:hypothetical protein
MSIHLGTLLLPIQKLESGTQAKKPENVSAGYFLCYYSWGNYLSLRSQEKREVERENWILDVPVRIDHVVFS